MRRILISLALLIGLAVPAFATDYHVRTDGNDSNTGLANTSGSAWLTLGHAVASITCGDTAYVHAGTYNGQFGATAKGCTTWSNPVRLAAWSGDTVVLTATGLDVIGAVVGSQSSNSVDCPPDQPTPCYVMTDMYWIIEGFDFDASTGSFSRYGTAFVAFMTRHVRLLNNDFHDAGDINVAANADNGYHCSTIGCTLGDQHHYSEWERPQVDLQIIGGSIYGAGRYCLAVDPPGDKCHNYTQGNGDGHAGYLSVKDSLVDGVEIYDNAGQSPQFTNSGGTDDSDNVIRNSYIHDNGAGVAFGPGQRTIAYNNVIENSGAYAIGTGAGACFDCKIFSNTLIGNGIVVYLTSNMIIKNNLFLDGATINQYDPSPGTVIANNYTGASASDINMDFTLKSTSNAIGAGADLSGYAIAGLLLDAAGLTRKNPPDAGAYEFDGTAAPLIASVTPSSLTQGDTAQNLAIVGTNTTFSMSSVTTTGCVGVTVNSTTFTNTTHVTANVTVSGGATVGSCTVTVTTGAEVALLANALTIDASTPPNPVIASLTPDEARQFTTDISIAIVGTNTHFTSDTVFALSDMGGITLLSFTRNSNTSATIHLGIGLYATAGSRDVTMTTGTEVATLDDGLTITEVSNIATQTLANSFTVLSVATEAGGGHMRMRR